MSRPAWQTARTDWRRRFFRNGTGFATPSRTFGALRRLLAVRGFFSFPRSAWECLLRRSASRVEALNPHAAYRDAERPGLHSHAERGNEAGILPQGKLAFTTSPSPGVSNGCTGGCAAMALHCKSPSSWSSRPSTGWPG
jgi:hypothetical protein